MLNVLPDDDGNLRHQNADSSITFEDDKVSPSGDLSDIPQPECVHASSTVPLAHQMQPHDEEIPRLRKTADNLLQDPGAQQSDRLQPASTFRRM